MATPRPKTDGGASGHTGFTLLNAVVAYTVATLATVTWHELGHAFGALSVGITPTVYPYSVSMVPDAGGSPAMWHTAAGPLLSLVTGLALLPAARRCPPGFWGLTLLVTCLANLQTFFGYLVTAPFMADGDIGALVQLAGLPSFAAWVCFAAGIGLSLVVVGRLCARYLPAYLDPAEDLLPAYLRSGLVAWTLGTLVVLLLSLGGFDWGRLPVAVVIFTMIGAWSAHVYILYGLSYLRRHDGVRRPQVWAVPVGGIILMLALAALRQFVFAPGLTL